MPFHLHKWYLDCVGPSGETAIVYSARLRWGLLDLNYGALILGGPRAAPTQRQAWRCSPPGIEEGVLRWEDPGLDAEGTWEAIIPGEVCSLHEGIRWRCLQPGGDARLRLPSGQTLRGRGYAEELWLDLPPWRLPFRELRWGRFVPDEGAGALAWIQWREGLERGWCFREGVEVPLESCDGEGVAFPGGRLSILPGAKLREGFPLRHLLGWASALCPGRLRRLHEDKELARGRLEGNGAVREGWVIHETVRLG